MELIKYSDRHNIVSLFTRDRGRVSFLVSAGNGKSARLRNSILMPLGVIAADVNFSNTRELQFLNTFTRIFTWKDLYFNPAKSAISMFLSEFLNTYLRQSGPDENIWEFITDSIGKLDKQQKGIANFHLAFLIEFLKYSGIWPDLSNWKNDNWFDMQGGVMTEFPPAHRQYLVPDEASQLKTLLRMSLNNSQYFKFSSGQRRVILGKLLTYYSIHFPGMSNLKSPTILSEVFS